MFAFKVFQGLLNLFNIKSLTKNTTNPVIKIINEILNPGFVKNDYIELADKAII